MRAVVGHESVVAALARSLEVGRLSHAYLLIGPQGIGKRLLALNLAAALNCAEEAKPCGECSQCRRATEGKHADVQVISVLTELEGPGRKVISIDQIKEMQQAAGLQPFEGSRRVFIIDGAEHLSADAANSLLKLLEEPPAAVCLVLLATSEEEVLPTIRSRCRTHHLKLVSRQATEAVLTSGYGVDPERASLLARQADGRIGWAISAALDPRVAEDHAEQVDDVLQLPARKLQERLEVSARLANDFSRHREEVFTWLGLMRSLWRDVLLFKAGCDDTLVNVDRIDQVRSLAAGCSLPQIAEVLRETQATVDKLERNANPRLALDVLFLGLPRLDGASPLAPDRTAERTAR